MNLNDLGVYRPRSNTSVGVSLVRNSSNTSPSLTNYRPNYSSTSSIARASLAAAAAKERTITSSSGGYRNTGISKIADKHRTSTENIHGKSSVSEKSSLFEKYPYPSGKITSSSLAEKYGNRIYGREKIREPETSQRYVASTFPGSRLRGNYGGGGGGSGELRGGEKKVRPEHPPVSYRTVRTPSVTSSRSSREPSPEVSGTKASPIKVYARGPNYRQSPSLGESPCTIKFANSSRLNTTINRNASISTEIPVGYSRSERLSTSNTGDIESTIKSDVENKNKANVALDNSDKIVMTKDDKVQDDDDEEEEEEEEEGEEDDDIKRGADEKEEKFKDKDKESSDEEDMNAVTLTVITRATSPGPPASSSFVRIRRADAARTIQWEITRVKEKIETKDVEIQCNRMDDTTRYSRFASGTRVSPWPSYLDKLHTPGSYSRMYRSSSSGKVRNFGYMRQSESLTQIPMPNESVVDVEFNSQNTNCQLKLSDSIDDSTPQDLSKTSHDNIPLNVTVNRVEKLQVIPVHQAQLPDKKHESTLQKRENSMSSVTSSGSSPSLSSLSSLSRRELLARSDGVTISTRGKSISRNGTMKSTKQRQMTRVDGSSDGSAVSLPTGKSKSASVNSSTSQSVKIKTTPSSLSSQSNSRSCTDGSSASTAAVSVNLRQCSNVEARGKPPVPKGNDNSFNMKSTGSSGSAKYINKDFRKSALNMPDTVDPTGRSKYHRKRIKNGSKSLSISSQDSAQNSSNSSKSCHDSRIVNNSKSELHKESKSPMNYGSVVVHKSTSDSKSSLSRNQDSICSTTSSSDISCDSSSSESSDEENPRSNSSREHKRINKTSNSPRLERKRRMSASSSRTSVLGSSADELSLTMDKPPRSMSSSKLRSENSSNKSDNSKSFLTRTLAPVKNLFKSKDDTTETDSRRDSDQRSKSMRSIHSSSTSNSSAKNLLNSVNKSENSSRKMKNTNAKIKHQYSGERAWWMDSNSDNIPDGVERLSQCQDDISQETTVSINLPDDGNYNARSWQHDAANEQTWNAKNHNDDRREMSSSSIRQKSSSYTNITTNDRKNNLKHQQSGERAWWMSEDPDEVPEGIVVYPSVASGSPISVSNDGIDNSGCFVENETLSRNVNRIRHVDSGEKPWWMDSNSNIPEGIQKLSPEIVESNSSSDGSSESFDKLDIRSTLPVVTSNIQPVRSISRFPIEFPAPPTDKPPLGDRASPEGVENPSECYEDSMSSYDNVHRRKSHRKRPSNLPLFIGNHTNIDDILGETVTPHYSNVMSQIHKQDLMNETWEESSECEEIDVAEVIIHDSTPKTPVIQRRGRDTERPQPDGYIPVKE
ncbi:hypothetical protein PV326_012695 [Microctonus aethiopoides]|nr:hypothetical protein PV326_012695 [Microctonus aethiopoides]